jgi:LmbE family N-acetylglucosaminyl deacetylase
VVEFCGRKAVIAGQPKGRRIAVIVAHPDDEVLGCGGTLRRHTLAGDEVWTIILADGETSRDAVGASHAVAGRESAARAAAHILGVQHVNVHGFPDNRLDSLALLDIVKVLEMYLGSIEPDTVYTHHSGDLNVDHRRVHEAVVTACRPQPGHSVQRLLFFEIPSSSEWQTPQSGQPFLPNWFVDVSATLDAKIQALKAYAAEMRAWPHPRSYEGIEHLARWRGATVGCMAAEAFALGREIRRPAR